MIGQTIYTFFNSLYDNTYTKIALYVTKRCDDPMQISDIVQEIYTEVYTVLLKKGYEHLQNPDAFVMHIAKKKLAKYYGLRSRFLTCMSLFSFTNESDEEFELPISDTGEVTMEEKQETSQLLSALCEYL